MLSAKVWRKESNKRPCKNLQIFSLLLLQTTLSVKSLSSRIAVWFSQQNHRRILSLPRPCGSRRLKPHRAGPKVYPQSLTTTTGLDHKARRIHLHGAFHIVLLFSLYVGIVSVFISYRIEKKKKNRFVWQKATGRNVWFSDTYATLFRTRKR